MRVKTDTTPAAVFQNTLEKYPRLGRGDWEGRRKREWLGRVVVVVGKEVVGGGGVEK